MKTGELISELRGREIDRLIENVKEWGRFHKIDNVLMQYCKTTEELSELAHEFTRGRQSGPEVIDALGDTTVCLIILADILGYDLMECLESAYNVIKDRKGQTKNGSFVKEQ